MTKRVAQSIDELQRELTERMRDVPCAYHDGVRNVPVAYHVEATPLVDAEDFIARDRQAARELKERQAERGIDRELIEAVAREVHRRGVARVPYQERLYQERRASPLARNSAFMRYVNAQQSDDGIGTSFMTPAERSLASYEWGERLRKLINDGKRRDTERERNRVVCDPQWED
jgi:hypothetical protein